MKRLLMVSPHFPPDTSAGTHRVRLLAPHLPELGWRPTVVSVDPRDYEGRLDPDLAALVPPSLEVIRVRAFSPRWTRKLGVGDLGLRAFGGLYRACRDLLSRERFDGLFVTIFPSYPALLGPLLKRRFGVPFVLDYQDPWVGSWGLTTGGGANGRPDAKSRLSRGLARRLEPRAVRAADALTAVSEGTLEGVRERIEEARALPSAVIPIGGDASDFEHLRAHPRRGGPVDFSERRFHLCYVGTLLPLGLETLRAFLSALVLVKERRPDVYPRLAVHFVGTSNQTTGTSYRVLPEAERLGVADAVREHPARVDYLDALGILARADAILLLGSSERHYTASKLYPALLARRALLALYHEESSVVSILRRALPLPAGRLVTYGEAEGAGTRVAAIFEELTALASGAPPRVEPEPSALEAFSARALARRLAELVSSLVRERAG